MTSVPIYCCCYNQIGKLSFVYSAKMLFKICTIVALVAIFADCKGDDSILTNVKTNLEGFGHAVGEKVGKAADSVKEHFSSAKDSISDGAKDVKDAVGDKIEDGGSFFENVGKGIKNAMQAVGEKFGEATDYIGEKIGIIKPKSDAEIAKKAAEDAYDDLKNLARSRLVRRSVEISQ